jgi:D-alanyl-D-alanine dipeptidase
LQKIVSTLIATSLCLFAASCKNKKKGDDFSDAASHSFPANLLPPDVSFNRDYLKNIMTTVGGLVPYNAEWWHYSVENNKDYPLLDFQIK